MDIQEQLGEVKVDLVGVKKDIRSLEIRMEQQDEFNKSMRDVATSVQLMAQNMQQMLEKQAEIVDATKENGREIQALKLVPAKKWSTATTAILTGAIGVIVGVVVNAVLSLI